MSADRAYPRTDGVIDRAWSATRTFFALLGAMWLADEILPQPLALDGEWRVLLAAAVALALLVPTFRTTNER